MLSRSFHSVPGGEELCAVVVVRVIKQHHPAADAPQRLPGDGLPLKPADRPAVGRDRRSDALEGPRLGQVREGSCGELLGTLLHVPQRSQPGGARDATSALLASTSCTSREAEYLAGDDLVESPRGAARRCLAITGLASLIGPGGGVWRSCSRRGTVRIAAGTSRAARPAGRRARRRCRSTGCRSPGPG